jgi:UPF0271 protein
LPKLLYHTAVDQLDLNADVGESLQDVDDLLIPLMTSINVACGAHAGDLDTMRHSVDLALKHGVAIGAHPGYRDREGFGRRPQKLSRPDLIELVREQVERLQAVATGTGAELKHVKPHGALYNQAESDPEVAEALARAVKALPRPLRMVGRAGSVMQAAAVAIGVDFVAEAFADRRYRSDGSLSPRCQPGSVLTDPEDVAAQVRELVQRGRVRSDDGTWVAVTFRTLCLHGDTPGAVTLASRIRSQLVQLGVGLRSPV